ncbi:MAG: Bug family tripartite tricarboxylate transporter substrate binding protein [Burkholderiales bacterium]
MKRLMGAIAVVALLGGTGGCGEQKPVHYPNRPITLIVPFPAAGSSDLIARVISERASRALGQPIIIDNRPGAGGNLGTETAAHATADGYTLVQCTIGTCAINPALYKNLAFDLDRDFQPVILFASISNVLAVHPKVPAGNVAELVAHARKNPGKLSFGSSGYGSSPHLSGELLRIDANIDVLHVPYRGSAPALTDLRGGQIDMFFDNSPSILPHIKSGDLRALAVTGTRRLASLPTTPTMEESGYPGFVIAPWFGLMVQKEVPHAIVEKLNRAYNEALTDPDLLSRLAQMEVSPGGGTAAAFGAQMTSERKRWGDLIQTRGIRAEELK